MLQQPRLRDFQPFTLERRVSSVFIAWELSRTFRAKVAVACSARLALDLVRLEAARHLGRLLANVGSDGATSDNGLWIIDPVLFQRQRPATAA